MSTSDSIAKILNDNGLKIFVTGAGEDTGFYFGADVSGLVLELIEVRHELEMTRAEAAGTHVGEYRRAMCELAMYVSEEEWDSAMRNLPKKLRLTNDEACAEIMGKGETNVIATKS